MHLNLNGKLHSLNTPIIMGIANFTEDSFYDGGKYFTEKDIVERVAKLLEEGADIIDIGAVSTRPGAVELDEETEINRITTVIRAILSHFPDTILSIDTWRASVAKISVQEGAAMINDISGGTFDEKMIPLIGELNIPYCLMHTTAKPDKMQQTTQYNSVLGDILYFLGKQLAKLKEAGASNIIIDPGFGFGKTVEQNYHLMANLQAFSIFNLPVLVGISRKSMINKLLGTTPEEALNGTTILNTISLMQGAHILRVHDVRAAKEAVLISQKTKECKIL